MPLRRLYTLAWNLALPLALLRLAWRGRRQPAYRKDVGQRLGRDYPRPGRHPLIWIHAVSVGETRAAQPLVEALLATYPRHRILLTQMTPTGQAAARDLFGTNRRVLCAYLPWDLPAACARFIAHFRPQLGILLETELWPNLVAACERAGVPVALVNARLSERSARRYRKVHGLIAPTLAALRRVVAQSPEDAARLETLGAREVHIAGNLKFDIAPPGAQRALARRFRHWLGDGPVLLLASSRDGEEAPWLAAFLRDAPAEARLVIVPRHPQRFDAVAQLLDQQGVRWQRRSDERPLAPDCRVWLGDSMGEMFAYYGAADLAVMGGSWAELGGQNPIEAMTMGTPVLCGPHTFNFARICIEAIEAEAMIRARDVEEGLARALELLRDAPRRATLAAHGQAFAAAQAGATARTLAALRDILPAETKRPAQGGPSRR